MMTPVFAPTDATDPVRLKQLLASPLYFASSHLADAVASNAILECLRGSPASVRSLAGPPAFITDLSQAPR